MEQICDGWFRNLPGKGDGESWHLEHAVNQKHHAGFFLAQDGSKCCINKHLYCLQNTKCIPILLSIIKALVHFCTAHFRAVLF